jgi:hypothetical protein
MLLTVAVCALLAQTPQPFPKAGAQKPATPAPTQSTKPPVVLPPGVSAPNPATGAPKPGAAPANPTDAPTEAMLGVQLYPDAQFITSFDAGKGQRYYLFGTNTAYAEIANFYRTVLKQKGELIYEEPAILEFDIGKFKEESMAFPPSVTVKDYGWGGSAGYLNPVRGKQPARFKTIIQIVPNPPM